MISIIPFKFSLLSFLAISTATASAPRVFPALPPGGHHPFNAAEGEEDQLLLKLIVVRHVVQQVGLQCSRVVGHRHQHHFEGK